jgi:LysR family transcriptional regulator, cell division regulator
MAGMELSDLTVFAAVARCRGITRAAGELNTVQSNVTARVQALEAEIGLPLFERHNRGVRLTDAGKRLLPYAERLAVMSREAILAARDDGCPKGPLLIGSMETTAAVRLPPVLARFHRKFPQVALSLQTGPTAALTQDVVNGVLDGAFVAGPISHPDLHTTRAFREELVLITAARWQTLEALKEAKRTAGISILVFRTGCSYRQRLEQILADMGWPCAARLELGTLDGIIGCVSADMGVTLLPRAIADRADFRSGIRAHTLAHPQCNVDTLFVRHAGRRTTSALESLVTCLTDAAADDVARSKAVPRPTKAVMRPTGRPAVSGTGRAARRHG